MQVGSCDSTLGISSSVFRLGGIRIARSRGIDGFGLPIGQCGEPCANVPRASHSNECCL